MQLSCQGLSNKAILQIVAIDDNNSSLSLNFEDDLQKEEPKQAKDEKMGEDENAKEAEPSAEGPQPDSSEPMEQ